MKSVTMNEQEAKQAADAIEARALDRLIADIRNFDEAQAAYRAGLKEREARRKEAMAALLGANGRYERDGHTHTSQIIFSIGKLPGLAIDFTQFHSAGTRSYVNCEDGQQYEITVKHVGPAHRRCKLCGAKATHISYDHRDRCDRCVALEDEGDEE